MKAPFYKPRKAMNANVQLFLLIVFYFGIVIISSGLILFVKSVS